MVDMLVFLFGRVGKRTPTSRPRHASQQVQAQVADESSPELTTDKPIREKEGVKFRKSPRKRPPKEPIKSVSINGPKSVTDICIQSIFVKIT